MKQTGRNTGRYITYDYKDVDVEESRFSFFVDAYASFGWEIDENAMAQERNGHYPEGLPHGRRIRLHLKRERKIMNKAELTRLQRNFESCMQEVDKLERSKIANASVWALSVGMIGTAFMAGSVFAVTAQPPHILLCILLAIPAFVGWITPYFIYKRIVAENTRRITPFMEAKYNEMYELCEKGGKLLYQSLREE